MVAAPHTSNWDFPLTLAMAWLSGFHPRWLGKKSLFRGPAGPIMRALGGIEVDRDDPGGLVGELVARLGGTSDFALIVPAEGTRSKSEYWKSGFYRIARQADLPLVLAFMDGPTRTGGFGPTIELSGDVTADMDRIRAFYADKHGLRPEHRAEPRLRDESAMTNS